VAHRDHPAGEYDDVVHAGTQFIDVREPHEFSERSFSGAVNIPLDLLPGRLGELDKARRTVLLCRSGGRSTTAAELLTAAGFTEVINLDGGMFAYMQTEGRPTHTLLHDRKGPLA
jgi:rhodanese-related sulfurtransferase